MAQQQQMPHKQKQKQKPERLFRQNNNSRPQIFVHVEFGVSWSPTHVPNSHGVTYRSRALRDRSPNFPRHIPPATTNYLAPSTQEPRRHHHHQQRQQNPAHHQHQPRSQPQAQYPQQSHYQHHGASHQVTQPSQSHQAGAHHQARQRAQPPPPIYTQEQFEYYQQVNEYIHYRQIQQQHQARPQQADGERRPSRESRGSHERGRSAPPPINESPWDVTQNPAAFPAGSQGAVPHRPTPELWKTLPETPSRFRLGEEDLPWASPWTFPMGYHPEADPDEAASAPGSVRGDRGGSLDGYFGSSHVAAHPGPAVETPMYSENDPQQTRELETLQAAMMTVDNGFEAQWWNQGERDKNVGASLGLATPPPASPVREALPSMTTVGMTPSFLQEGQRSATMPVGSIGWAIANPTRIDEDLRSHRRRDTKDTERSRQSKNSTSSGNLVSPMSDSASSFSPSFVSPVNRGQRPHRTMSTRSEELHMG
ncbi:uncharacterized protein E0L32_009185 [Thyridium curvatum]|uniref:Uncharacterized protein n=1 Tax=Thyridium curvatum TaxID=1093900 RepID=A0A507ASU7_9PEZI|nr:uncharacterized protein E0L32_009185 [Thyridium curvatum]TPX09584.1 hypothetical protein E0L32_009185 [Thyridium curvatum]